MNERKQQLFSVNNSVIVLSKNLVFHKRGKNIDTKYHFIREFINNGENVLHHYRLQDQFVDIFTNPLVSKNFVHLTDYLWIVNGYSFD